VEKIITKSASVTQQYLLGRLLLIAFLSVFYAIGLGISGVNNFILVSVIAAILSLIPYLGNIIGFGLALVFGYLTSGDFTVLIGISLTFVIGQFIESYILTPYIVGDKVDLHPFLVILVVIIGNLIWGIIGMLLAIPVIAIVNVVLLNIAPLKPFGYLLSKEDREK
jgi:predicted PurR-regulated permease PerM